MKSIHDGKVAYLSDEIKERLEKTKYTVEQEIEYKAMLGTFRNDFFKFRRDCEEICFRNIEAEKNLIVQISKRKSDASLQEQTIKMQISELGNEIESYGAQVGEWKKNMQKDTLKLVNEKKLAEAWKCLNSLCSLPDEATNRMTIKNAFDAMKDHYNEFVNKCKPMLSDIVEKETIKKMNDDLMNCGNKIVQLTKEGQDLTNENKGLKKTIGNNLM